MVLIIVWGDGTGWQLWFGTAMGTPASMVGRMILTNKGALTLYAGNP